jgi:hypothetical protein
MSVVVQHEKYDTAGAVSYLRQRFPELESSEKLKDTFYHQVVRGRIPHEKIQQGSVLRYRFAKHDLDQVVFRKAQASKPERQRKGRKAPEDWGLSGVSEEVWQDFEPVAVHTDTDLERLRNIFGPLVDGEGLRQLLYEKFGVCYSTGAIKRRRYRGSILCVGFSGVRRRTYWYPAVQVDVLHWQPENTKKAKSDRN